MRVVIQRVSEASVSVQKQCISSIHSGLLVLLGIEASDTQEDIEWLCKKIVQLRVFDDEHALPNLSLSDIAGELLIVSQFTLFASTRKGNRPGYSRAAPPAMAEPLYEKFISHISGLLGRPVKTGRFGADMQIHLVNSGPLTIFMDSKNKE